MPSPFRASWLALALAATGAGAAPPEASFSLRSLTPETALQAAQAALQACRAQGYQVAVAVVDRGGLTQVLLRDRFAGPHTVGVATDKAWTALSFRSSTLDLVEATAAGKPMNGIRAVPRMLAVGGGILVEGGGSIFGAIGVSGAPSGEVDDACAKAGLKAIADAIAF
ncbi:MAG: heme-binding protein [Burkholderiales bacterium]|nr:heme-binding protein [Burkholderiales bacterium]